MINSMKNITMVLVTVALFLMIPASPSPASDRTPSDKLSEIMKRGRIIIAMAAEYFPMSDLAKDGKRSSETKCSSIEYTSGQVTGFETDVAKEVARRLGLEVCFVTPAWGEMISGRWADRWDIVFASISITSERMESLYFAKPYSSEPAVFYVHKDNTAFKTPADLSGKRIGVCTGCIFEHYLEGTLTLPGEKTQCPAADPEIVAYDTEMKIFADLSPVAGTKLDAVLSDMFIGNKAISEGMPVRQLGEPVFYTYIAPAIDKKQSRNPIAFIKKINEIIMQMHNDGTLSGLAEKYFSLKTDLTAPAKKFDIQSLGQ